MAPPALSAMTRPWMSMTGEPGRTARRARGRLQVERIEVVVLADAVFGRIAIELGDGAGEDGELLAGVVADDADLAADLRAVRIQRQRARLDEAQLLRVVAIDAEVVDRIAIHRIELHFLAIEERGFRGHRARRDHVAIGEDEAPLGVDDEARGLRGGVPFGVERARLVDFDGDHALGDARQRAAPRGALTFGLRQCRLGRRGLRHHLRGRVLRPACCEKGRCQEDQADRQQTWLHAVSFVLLGGSAPQNQQPDHRQQQQ